jgi:hypothetical protein
LRPSGRRCARGITPLHPDCNYIDIMEQDLAQAAVALGGESTRADRDLGNVIERETVGL